MCTGCKDAIMSKPKNSGKKSIKKSKRQRAQKSKSGRTSQKTSKRNKTEPTLKAAENLYLAVMNNNHFGFTLIDRNYKIILVNGVMSRFFNKPASELIGRECFREYEKRDSICLHCPGRKTMATGHVAEVETEGVRDDGVRISVRNQAFPVLDSDGEITGFIEIVEDITERKNAEKVLRQQHNLLRLLIDNLPDSIYVKDSESRFILANPAVVKYEGMKTEKELLGKTDFDLYPKDWAMHFHAEEQEVIQKHRPLINQERFYLNKYGKEQWVLTTKVPLKDDKGKIIGLVGINRDITEHKKAEQALRDSEELYHAIFDQAADSVVLIDTETGKMVEFNDKAHENLEYTREEFEKLRLADIEVIESEEDVAKHIKTIIKKGSDIFETRHRTKSGEQRNIQVSTRAISLRGKNFIQGIWRDITEHKKAEQKLREDQKQLRSLASELTLAEERERRRVAGMLHDQISQSLVISKMRLESLCKSGYDKKMDATLEEICNSLGQTIKDMRSLIFRVSSPILEQLGFVEAVQDWLVEEIEAKHGIQTEFDDDGQDKPLDDDVSALLFRNVRELLINVVKHAHAKKAKVSIDKVDSKIKVCVEDDGIGFDPGKVVTKAVGKGGFGLFSIRQRLEQFGGNLEIKSRPNHGCRVVMTVPLKQK